MVGSTDNRFGTEINRMRVLQGRVPNPDAPDEVAISSVVAERRGIEVGDLLQTSRLAGSDSPRLTVRS